MTSPDDHLGLGVFLMLGSVDDVVRRAQLAEELGFEFVGVSDSQMLHYDTYVAMTAVLHATHTIRVGPWVTNPVTRHPSVTANAISTLDAMSNGRAFLGIGYGDSAVRSIGLRSARLAELRAAVEMMRGLAEGRDAPGIEPGWRLSTARGGITIYWAADGPKQLQDAGELADGVIANGWLVENQLAWMIDNIRVGAGRAGRSVDELEMIFNTGVSIADSTEAAYGAIKPYVGRALCHDVSEWIPEWPREKSLHMREMYDYRHHMHSEHDVAAAIPDAMVPKKVVAGTSDECVDLLMIPIAAGFRKIALFPFGDIEQTLTRLAREVLPKVRSKLELGPGP